MMCHSYGVLLFLDIVISHVMHCLLLLLNYKSPRKPTFASIEPSRTIVVVESGSRNPSLLLDNCVKKLVPNVEPHFIVMGVQKIQCSQTRNKFAMPTTATPNLRWFGEQELLLPLLSIRSPSFCEDLDHTFKIK